MPHEGCKNSCAFCDQRTISGSAAVPTVGEAREIIENHLATMNGFAEQIAFFGGSFTGISKEKQNEYLALAEEYIKKRCVRSIRLSTRPDYIDSETVKRLLSYGVKNIELGAQSMDNCVLKAANRGHSAEDVERASEIILNGGAVLGLQMMTGLFRSTPDKDFETGVKIAELSPATVRIYPTVVLDGTHLASLYKSGEYVPYELDATVELCSRLYSLFTENGIRIIRMGLQSTDIICEKGNILGGAYHSSFGELVLSRLWRNKIEEYVCGHIGEKKLTMKVPARYVSQAVGNKRENIKYIKEKYGTDIKITGEKFE